MKKIEAVKFIRKELRADFTRWGLIEKLSKEFGLQDTAYRDKVRERQKEGLLRDYLLDLKYWKSRKKK